jgi:uncharacterized membrane protein
MTLQAAVRPRIESVDLLRGFVMVIMALDHTRDYFGQPGISPTNLAQATAPLFFTRWITNICAPVFFLLTGTGAGLALGKKTKSELSRFLLTRGLWLIFLEIVVLRCFALQFNFDFHVTLLVVIWALGWAMITLAALLNLPLSVITAFSVVMIVTHNLLDLIPPAALGKALPLALILHSPGFLWRGPDHTVFVAYPLIPWVGVTALGFSLWRIFSWQAARRQTFLLRLGLAMCAAFVVLRWMNYYGDPFRWSHQKSGLYTVLSFLNTAKYPPSLLFLLMTLGPAMLLLWAFERWPSAALRPLLGFGRVPLFFYFLHLVLIHSLAVAVCYLHYGHVYWMFQSPDVAKYPVTPPPGWGFGLPTIYALWALVVIALYPVCRWFAELKQRRQDAWLSYF